MVKRIWSRIQAVVVLLIVSFLGLMLFGFNINLPFVLEAAQTRWEAKAVENYRYQVGFGSFSYVGDVWITRDNGRVLIEQSTANPLNSTPTDEMKIIGSQPNWYTPYFNQVFPEDLSHYTVDGLFAFWAAQQAENPQPLMQFCSAEPRYEVRFNPEWGYIEGLRSTNCATSQFGLGLLCPAISDCSIGFSISNFQVLSD
jgi:hypothetical protein